MDKFSSEQSSKQKKDYDQRKHFNRIIDRYNKEVKQLTADQVGWYIFHEPILDEKFVQKDLIDLDLTSRELELERQQLLDLLLQHDVKTYSLGDRILIVRTQMDGKLLKTPIKRITTMPAPG